MPAFILDTDTLSLYQQGHPRVTPAVDLWPDGALGLTIISVEEQFTGWLGLVRQSKRVDRISAAYDGWVKAARSFKRFDVVGYSVSAIARFQQLKKLLPGIGGNDLRIAAIALEAGATVVTKNRADFGRVPGLTIVDWSV
jgi:tRNA(fMet)-specific endonuclease VapC